MLKRCAFALLLAVLCLAQQSLAQQTPPVDLTGTSLEDLMNIQVTSVSRKEQPLSKAPSAIFVITQDDIRRSGATNIPDLLRIVPGVDVARINANTWAISIRGFNYRYSSKVLVLIDGRTVYSPLFSGVYWDQQTVPLENIERIEVIRGPGGTVWGANAMNGVINIITKSAAETHGLLVSAEVGSQDRAQELVQYGGTVASGSWRVYARYTMNENSRSLPGSPAVDEGHNSQVGFRSDWNLSSRDKMTVQGDLFGASDGQTITTLFTNQLPGTHILNDQVRVASGNVLGRWNHVFSNGSETTLQVYYDRFRRNDQALNVVNTGDVDFQYHFHLGTRHDIVAGIGYRLTDWTDSDGYELSIGSGYGRESLFSSFIQDEIALTGTLALTIGSKFEHNAYTGFEYEPSAQLAWSPAGHGTVWASISKAIQQPSALYQQSQLETATVPLANGSFGLVQLNGNPAGVAPRMFDYELGYRTQVSRQLTLAIALFLSDYRMLPTHEPQAPYFSETPPPAHLVLPSIYENLGKARDYGVEFYTHWDATNWWRISPGFSFLQMDLSQAPGSNDAGYPATGGDSPKYQAQLRSAMTLPHKTEWDVSGYYVGALKGGSTALGPVAAYLRVDTRLAWRLGETAEVSLTGQNLLSPHRLEFLDGLQVTPMETARAVVVKITWHF